MANEVKVYENYKEIPHAVYEYVKKNALVQHYPIMGKAFSYPYFYYYFVSYDVENEINAILPLVIYKGEYGNVAHSLPYFSYSGIIGDEIGVHAIQRKIDSFLKEKEVITLSYCHHPFMNYSRNIKHDYQFENFFQYLELTSGSYTDKMNSKARNNLKRNLKKANAFKVVLEKSESTSDLSYWYNNIYVKRLEETHAPIYPYAIYEALFTAPHHRTQFIVAKIDEKIIGGALYLLQVDSIDLFMRVVESKYLHTQAGVLMDKFIIEQAELNKFKYFNWQSADFIDSPVFNYKKSWGSDVGTHLYLTNEVKNFKSFQTLTKDKLKSSYPGMYIAPYSVIFNEN